MKNYSLPVKLVVCGALIVGTFVLSPSPSYGQGRRLSTQQVDSIVTPQLSQCNGPGIVGATTTNGRTKQVKNARLDPYSIIPTANAVEPSMLRVAKTMHGMWRGQVIGSPLDTKYETTKEGNVDYFWIFDMARAEALIIALRNGNNSTAGLSLGVATPPKLSYLICAHEGYIPTVEKGSEIHEFTKVSHSISNAAQILSNATGLSLRSGATLSEHWQAIVASGYFQSLPAVAFAGGMFKPIQLAPVPSPIGPSQVSMSWNAEYYGGGTTWIKFTPGVPMRGVESSTFVVTTATAGDFLVASPGNGKLAKVEAFEGGDYDLAFDSVTFGPMCDGECDGICPECGPLPSPSPGASPSPSPTQTPGQVQSPSPSPELRVSPSKQTEEKPQSLNRKANHRRRSNHR